MAAEYTREENAFCNIPQDFADKKIGACPFCKVEEPKWLVKEEWKLFGNNYYFKCPHCETEFMATKDDITGLALTTASPAGKKKQKAGKIVNEPYLTVVKIGLKAKTHENILLQGEELTIPQLKELAGK